MKKEVIAALATVIFFSLQANAKGSMHNTHGAASDKLISEQRAKLAVNTKGRGFGPQSPRDIDAVEGNNSRSFNTAPAYKKMNLCNIHFHKNAESPRAAPAFPPTFLRAQAAGFFPARAGCREHRGNRESSA